MPPTLMFISQMLLLVFPIFVDLAVEADTPCEEVHPSHYLAEDVESSGHFVTTKIIYS